MTSSQVLLRFPFAVNVLGLLAPVKQMLTGTSTGDVFQGTLAESDGLRTLVGAVWCSVMFCSVLGLWRPKFMVPLLIFQVLYKAVWLGVYVVPRAQKGEAFPTQLTVIFGVMVLVYPCVLWYAMRGKGEKRRAD